MADEKRKIIDAAYDEAGRLVATYDTGEKKVLNQPQSPPPPPPPTSRSSLSGYVYGSEGESVIKTVAYISVTIASVAVTMASLISIINSGRK